MIAALAFLLVLATDPPNDYGATPLPDPARRAQPAAGVPRDTLTRVPGSPLRLGWTHERTSALGAFQQQGTSGDATIRHGDVRWFGTTSQATLTYRDDRLCAVRLECARPTLALLSYAPDELRRAGYRRVSHAIESGSDRSEWSGPAEIVLTASASSLVAEVSTRVAGTAAPASPASPRAGATAAAPPTDAAPTADESAPGALAGEIDFTATRTDSLPAPRVLSTPPPPVRPRIAVDAGLFGRVQVRARIDTTGHVVHAEIARGIAEFNSAALAWAADVRYEPYRLNGRLAPVVVLIPVVFSSQSDGARPSP